MDLRVYVDGVPRIICDLTRKTTVHDIIIALAQYKGRAGRYSLVQCAPDGTQRTLSPNELTCELIHRPEWIYVLRQSPSNLYTSNVQKRSKSLDERKTSIDQQQQQQPKILVDTIPPLNTSTGYFRTIKNHTNESSTVIPYRNRKRSNLNQVFPLINKNNNNNNNSHDSLPSPPLQKRQSRTPIQSSFEHHHTISYARPKSAVPPSIRETNAFYTVRNSSTNYINMQQQQQYIALLQILKSQEIQLEQQTTELNETQKEIEYYDLILHQGQVYHDEIQNEIQLLEEHERRLFSELQTLSQEYSTEKLNDELEYQKQLSTNYEHLQQQLTRCSSTLEQKLQLQEQIQYNIEQTHEDIEQMKRQLNNDQKEIGQCTYDLERSNASLKQQEELLNVLMQRNDEVERITQQRRKRILEVENEVTQLDDLLLNAFAKLPYHFNSTSSNDIIKPGHIQFMNSTLLKLCPSGIWV